MLSARESAYNARDGSLIPGSGRSLEEGMATHSDILAWRIPWTEDIGRLQSMGLQRVGRLKPLSVCVFGVCVCVCVCV